MMTLIKKFPINYERLFVNYKKNLINQLVNRNFSKTLIKQDAEIDQFLEDQEYQGLKDEFIKTKTFNQNVLVIQPYLIKKDKSKQPDPQLILDETVALAESIPNWKVVHKCFKGLPIFNQFNLLKQTTIQNIINEISDHRIHNLVIGSDWLNGAYHMKLENDLKIDVYDRYSMILKIFHLRSSTKEAKIQTALAEIPYIRARLNLFVRNPDHHQVELAKIIGVGGKDYYNKRKYLLDKREAKLKQELEKIEKARNLINPSKKANKSPVIGIVGYTNAGKSSLIKHLSKNKSIEPKDQLFATLDLSRFIVRLNNNQDVFLLDTIGFISNIPKQLLDAFNCTLKEILDCDLIVHIYDANHPDLENQKKTVYRTLFDQIKLTEKLKSTMIEVGNKIDLLNEEQIKKLTDENPEHLLISINDKINVTLLVERMQEELEKNLDFIQRKFKVKTGSEAYQFIIDNSTVKNQTVNNDDPNFCLIDVSMSKKNYHQLMKMIKK